MEDLNKILEYCHSNIGKYFFKNKIQTLFEDKRFRIPEDSKIISDYYEVSNNNVLMWYKNIDKEYTSIAKAYGDYMLYCVNSGYKPVSIGKFTGEFNKLKKGFN